LKIYILQDNVATQLRYGSTFSNHLITNFPRYVLVKSVRKYGHNFVPYFFGPPCNFCLAPPADLHSAPPWPLRSRIIGSLVNPHDSTC